MGETTVADQLERLRAHGWFLLHDVRWPGRPKASLDHVLVGPGGILVVDAKNWSGEVNVAAGVLWQGRFAKTQSVEGALAQCAAVASILAPAHRRFVRPLICISGQPGMFGITSSDVAVAGPDRAIDAILALPVVLDAPAVTGLYAHLRQELTGDPSGGSAAAESLAAELLAHAPGPGPTVVPKDKRRNPAKPAPQGHSTRSGPAHGRSHPSGTARGLSRQAPLRHSSPRHGQLAQGQGASGAGRNPRIQHKAGGGMLPLVFLAAFVVFAVYVLPYWGQ